MKRLRIRAAMKYCLIFDIVLILLTIQVMSSSCKKDESSGPDNTLNTDQIIADHTVVDKYDDIPAVYMAEIKKMWLSYTGESHSVGVRNGLASLEALYPSYAVDITTVPPRPYTEVNLRANGTTWGDVSNETGWISNSGEEDWFTSALAVTRKKAGLTYCATTGPALNAFGFGWCWDPAIINATEYLDATQQYIDYCAANSISTKVFFTTGPVDGSCATGELGYNKNLMYEAIRTYAKANSSRILFDYADILCYDDGDQTPNTTTWNGHVYPVITETNLNPVYSGHISQSGGIRIAKALWWMLARMAGWDGKSK